MVYESTAVIEVLYCFTVAIGLSGNASDYNEVKRSAVKVYAKQGGCRVRKQ